MRYFLLFCLWCLFFWLEDMNIPANNEQVFMTRRYPALSQKVLVRDGVIAKKIIQAWDVEHDADKVLSIFIKEKNNFSDERYWEMLRTVWIVSGGLKNVDIFRQLFLSKRKERFYFTTPEDAKKLRELPDVFNVYRAGSDNDGGISWTLSKEYAETYQKQYAKEKIMMQTILKKVVFAYIQRNKEDEIIIL